MNSNSPDVVVLGPFPPVRGGIARHSGAVAQAFAELPDIRLRRIGFSRLYPAWLYPGEAGERATGPEALLDTLNPLTWFAVRRDLEKHRPDLLVIPAWTFFVAPVLSWIAAKARRAGVKVAMIVHNASDHEAGSWKNRMLRKQLAQADLFVTHSQHQQDELRRAFPATPVLLQPHPAYCDFPDSGEDLPRRAATELLFFGYVREYKGLNVLLDAIERLPDADVMLTVAGEIWSGGDDLRKRVASPPLAGRVELLDRYIDDTEVAPLMRRCNALVLPYHSATGSGVVATAHHFAARVIATDIPGLAEAVEPAQGDVLIPPGNADALAAAIERLHGGDAAKGGVRRRSGTWQAYCQALLAAAIPARAVSSDAAS